MDDMHLVTSLYVWFVLGSDLSSSQVMGRYVPDFMLQGEKEKLQKFFSNLLTVSLLSGGLCACFYLLFTSLWLTDLDLILARDGIRHPAFSSSWPILFSPSSWVSTRQRGGGWAKFFVTGLSLS